MWITSLDRVENTVGKGENARNHYFLLFSDMVSNVSSVSVVNDKLLIKQQNFRLAQFESICRRQHICGSKIEFVFWRVENVAKGENAGYQHFLLFRQNFQKVSFSGLLLVVGCIGV